MLEALPARAVSRQIGFAPSLVLSLWAAVAIWNADVS